MREAAHVVSCLISWKLLYLREGERTSYDGFHQKLALDLRRCWREMGGLGFQQKYKKHNLFQPVSLWCFWGTYLKPRKSVSKPEPEPESEPEPELEHTALLG